MYSHEIDRYMTERNYKLTRDEYKWISSISRSPQISEIKYDCFNNNFNIYTKDGYHWTFTLTD